MGLAKMNPDAHRILDSAGLPHPKRLQLDRDPVSQDLPSEIYLRPPSREGSPRRMSAAAFRQLLEGQDLSGYSAVEFVPSVAGAVSVMRGRLVLVEIVLGHLSGLLQEGLLRARLLVDWSRQTIIASDRFSQGSWIDPRSLTKGHVRFPAWGRIDLDEIATEVALRGARSGLDDHMLTEIMVAHDRLVWVDAKRFAWDIDLNGMFSPERKLIYGSTRGKTPLDPVDWTPAAIPGDIKSRSLSLGGHPLGCHFVKYSLERGLHSLYNRSPN
jgi:hypothetical protein